MFVFTVLYPFADHLRGSRLQTYAYGQGTFQRNHEYRCAQYPGQKRHTTKREIRKLQLLHGKTVELDDAENCNIVN